MQTVGNILIRTSAPTLSATGMEVVSLSPLSAVSQTEGNPEYLPCQLPEWRWSPSPRCQLCPRQREILSTYLVSYRNGGGLPLPAVSCVADRGKSWVPTLSATGIKVGLPLPAVSCVADRGKYPGQNLSTVPTLSASGIELVSLSPLSAVSQTDMSMASSRLSVLFRLWKLSSALCLEDSLTFLFIIIELRRVINKLLVSLTYCFCSVPVMRHSCTGWYQLGKMIKALCWRYLFF